MFKFIVNLFKVTPVIYSDTPIYDQLEREWAKKIRI